MQNLLKNKLKTLPSKPGVYQWLDAAHHILYVGKAKNLKKRISQYFRSNLDKKTNVLMSKAQDFSVIITENENQALLLESNLIKKHHPRYNVLLRDDKAYPYLFLSTQHRFPRLDFYRGKKRDNGRYFGPYPSAGAVRDNLALIQKLFQLRQCRDGFFRNRSRPCLQYQIHRCTAPCVGYVTEEQYQSQAQDTIQFLEGKNVDVIHTIEARMQSASSQLDFETAAHCRDVLIRLRQLQRKQFITGGIGNIDIFGLSQKTGHIAIAVVSIRHGQLLGHQVFFPKLPEDTTASEALSAFIPQYYLNSERSSESIDRIVSTEKIIDRQWIQNALQMVFSKKIDMSDRKNPAYREWKSIAQTNAEDALKRRLNEKNQIALQLELMHTVLHLPSVPSKIECFDISHTSGQSTKASCVVFGVDGPVRQAYRQFDITDITPGDDYAAMRQVFMRRYTRLKSMNRMLPDLIIVDGGKGQLQQAALVLEELQITGVMLMGVAKGPSRKPGLEKLLIWGRNKEIHLEPDHPALHLIQQIRDEAHRFAITAHRKKRGKQQLQSKLDQIAGVGKKRRAALLQHFGGYAELKKASEAEIAAVQGVSAKLAKHIYAVLHEK